MTVGWVLLVLGVLLGMAWGILHLWIVPRIADYRPWLERLTQQTLGVPVRIGELSAQSTGWAPSFELRRIELLDVQGRTALRLPRVMVAVSIQSVLQLRLEQLVLDAPELDIRLTASGQWQIAGLDWAQTPRGERAAADWLFSQKEVLIRNGTLRWTDERAQQPLPALRHFGETHDTHGPRSDIQTLALRDVDLVLRNASRQHDIRLDATPPEDWGERFVGMGQFKRGLLSTHAGLFDDWSGQVYAYFPQVDVSQLRQHVQLGADIRSGQGALRMWHDFEKGQWTGGAADTDLKDLNVHFDAQHPPLALERLSGRVAVRFKTTGFELATKQLSFVTAQGLHWPGGNLALTYTPAQASRPQAAQGRLIADALDLEALRDLSLRLPLPDELHRRLQWQAVTGQVRLLDMVWQGPWQEPELYEVQATLENLSLRRKIDASHNTTPDWPGIQGAHVQLKMNQTGGQVQLKMGAGGAVFLPGILEAPLVPVDSLQAQARWQHKDGRWAVPQWSLQMNNQDLQGDWQGQWQASADGTGPGVLNLQGQIPQIQAARVHRYLPTELPASVREYLRDALVKGTYTGVKIKVNGDLTRLPFRSAQEGEFHVSGRLRDLELDYMPGALLAPGSPPWPRLYGLSGALVFDRQGMKLNDAKARTGEPPSGLLLSNIQARIPDLVGPSVLEVSAENKGPASQVLGWVQTSPLDKLLGSALNGAQANGQLQTRFKLNIPLWASEPTKFQGAVVLSGNDLRMTQSMPTLEKVQGQIQFNESGFTLNGVSARLLGGSVRLEGGMKPESSQASSLLLRAQGEVTAEGLRQAHEWHALDTLAKHFTGSTAYSAHWAWRDGQADLSVQSRLEGLALNLPAPLGKTAQTAMPLHIRSREQRAGTGFQDHVQIDLGGIASVQYIRDLSGPVPQVKRGSMALGNTRQMPPMPDAGVAAKVSLNAFSVDEWQTLWLAAQNDALRGNSPRAKSPLGQSYLPTRIALQSDTLTADGRTLHQVVAGVTREGGLWRADVDARELSGQVAFRQATEEQSGQLYARLARLNLPASSAAEVESLLESSPAQLPALDIVIDQLALRGKTLGRIEIEAVNSELQKTRGKPTREWQLNKFNIVLPEGTLRSRGRWLSASEGNPARKTEMRFQLDVQDAGGLLTRLGTPDALRGGRGVLEGDIHWMGSPLAFHYPSMGGQFNVKMGPGQFLKADAGAAKLLGVLSLQALPRRLLLDFRDVFYEGFAFDSATGLVTIDHGTAFSRDLQIQGINAVVKLEGSADIAKETQHLRAVILPLVDTGTASLVAGIAVNPLVGLTAFLAQLYLQNPLSRASAQEFLIDGSWSAPRVTRVESSLRSSDRITRPAGP